MAEHIQVGKKVSGFKNKTNKQKSKQKKNKKITKHNTYHQTGKRGGKAEKTTHSDLHFILDWRYQSEWITNQSTHLHTLHHSLPSFSPPHRAQRPNAAQCVSFQANGRAFSYEELIWNIHMTNYVTWSGKILGLCYSLDYTSTGVFSSA